MKVLAYILILAGLFMFRTERLDVGDLEPVEVVYLDKRENTVHISTDTGAEGEGASVALAVENLKNHAVDIIYLDTAKYLLVSPNALDKMEQMNAYMKETVQVCCVNDPDMEQAADYLKTHGKLLKLKDWKNGTVLPGWNKNN